MASDLSSKEQVELAFDQWWREMTRCGDPARRPHLTAEAFVAGWERAESDEVGSLRRALAESQQQVEFYAAAAKRSADEPSEYIAKVIARCRFVAMFDSTRRDARDTLLEAAEALERPAQPPEVQCPGCMGPCGQCDQPSDEARLAWIGGGTLFDVLCGVDIHERAASIAVAAGRDEPIEIDLAAAARDVIDAAMAEDSTGLTKEASR